MTAANRPGSVYLVGGGPGDPRLLTVRGQQLLRQAQAVVYDYLIDTSLLDDAPQAEHIYVGDAHEQHRVKQREINELLIRLAREGKTVVRLKGGDPFVFGRGGEEAQALRRAGIPFEVVPGVTSAIAVPAYAGIPVTHRDFASSVSVITGHLQSDKADWVDWGQIASCPGTLVFLMAMSRLDALVSELIGHGRPEDTPAAVIRWGTRPDQHAITGPLRSIAGLTRDAGLKAPAVVVVGEVVNLREELNWFEELPLFGVSVLVTRAREQASAFSESLRGAGATVYEAPAIAIQPTKQLGPVDEAIAHLRDYDWIIFTSANGVQRFCERAWVLGRDARAFGSTSICAIGPETGQTLARFGLRADIIPTSYVAESVGEALAAHTVKRALIPRAKMARDVLPRLLRERGAQVDVLEVYETVIPPDGAERLRSLLASKRIDVVTFTSSSTVTNFSEMVGKLPGGVKVACIGPITRRTAEERGMHVDIMADSYTTEGLKAALIDHFVELRVKNEE